MRRAIPQRFTGTVVELLLCGFDLPLGNGSERGLFRKLLAHQAVGIFVDAALPRGIRMAKIEIRCALPGDCCVCRKFSTVVTRDGLDDEVLQLGADRVARQAPGFVVNFLHP